MTRDAAANQLQRHAASNPHAPVLTTSNGAPIDSITASMTAGERGPILLQDFVLLDHLSKFDRERIPERVVHAKGAAAFGYFETTTDFGAKVCKAAMFQKTGTRTPVAVRFSTVGGETGSADTVRDPRGFAIKFYTSEGNWDLVGNNTPIFFLRDPILFPSFIHTQKRNPQTGLKDADMFWDFIGLRPETTHQVSFLFSDRGIPDGYRHMNGYGSHTFVNVNQNGEAVYVKYHFKTDQGIANLPTDEADKLASSDPDYSTRDLYNAIADENPPSWTLYLQVMTFEQASTSTFNPFDLTKIWPHSEYPLNEVGRMVLDRNPTNYFAEVEQLAFSPSHMIPGIEPSPDKMLQARLFSYPDTHRHRLGPNYQTGIPVNKPRTASNYQRDGAMMVSRNEDGAPNYFPNSFQGPVPQADTNKWHPMSTSDVAARWETGHMDNFSQAGEFYAKVLDAEARNRLTSNLANALVGAQPDIRNRAISNFSAAHVDYGREIKRKVDELLRSMPSSAPRQPAGAPLNPPRTVPTNKCPYGFSSKL